MRINDRVYGKQEITEAVLLDLIESKSLQRLKGVFQFMPPKYYHKDSFTRYEHSLGVLLLLRKLGAELKEQVAGLLHDTSHTAFSHVIDWAVGDPKKEDYQDKIHLEVIKNSEIPTILTNYGLDYREISQLEKFPLLEREAPDLCADRIDYSLRELKMEGKKIDKLLEDLIVRNNEIVFRTFESADRFAKNYINMQKEHWGGKEARLRYRLLAEVLREAIEKKIVSLDSLIHGQDYIITELLERKGNKEILRGLSLLKNKLYLEETDDGTGIFLDKKFRYVDPKFLVNGEVKRLSEDSLEYRKILNREKENSKKIKGILIK